MSFCLDGPSAAGQLIHVLFCLLARYREAGFHGPHMMDHTPSIVGDDGGISRDPTRIPDAADLLCWVIAAAVTQTVYADRITRSQDDVPTYAKL